jgi:imidazolonepropionase-like amidohydrolase
MPASAPELSGSRTGYIDAHVHLTSDQALLDVVRADIAAVRDAGTRQGTGLVLARSVGLGNRPRVMTAGRALSRKGGYGSFLGSPVSTRDEICEEIERLRREGADIIKVIASGVVSLERPGTITPGGFEADELRFIVEEAGREGLAVMAHANGEAAILAAAEAGVRSVEHGFFMTDVALRSLIRNGTYWVPTVGALLRASEEAQAPPRVKEAIDGEISAHLIMIDKAFHMGVPLAIGTDCVLPDSQYRGWFEKELALFRLAGISDDDVRRIATEGGRELLGFV